MKSTRESFETYHKKHLYYDDHQPRQTIIGSIAPDQIVTFGSATNCGKTIIVDGNIGKGTTIQLYGWDLHINGNVEDDVHIEFLRDVHGCDISKLCVEGSVGKNVAILHAFEVNVKGDLQNHCTIDASRSISVGNVGDNSRLHASTGNITCLNVGAHSDISSDYGDDIKCKNIGAYTKVKGQGKITVEDVAEKASIKSSHGEIYAYDIHASAHIGNWQLTTFHHVVGEKPSAFSSFKSLSLFHPGRWCHSEKEKHELQGPRPR